MVLEAVRQNWGALAGAFAELKEDRPVVLGAVKHCGDELRFAFGELKADKGLVVEAMRQGGATPWRPPGSSRRTGRWFLRQ